MDCRLSVDELSPLSSLTSKPCVHLSTFWYSVSVEEVILKVERLAAFCNVSNELAESSEKIVLVAGLTRLAIPPKVTFFPSAVLVSFQKSFAVSVKNPVDSLTAILPETSYTKPSSFKR